MLLTPELFLAVSAGLTVLGSFAAWLLNLSARLDRMDFRLTSLWEEHCEIERLARNAWLLQIRKGKTEAVSAGVAEMRSPVLVLEKAKNWIPEELRASLGELYSGLRRKCGPGGDVLEEDLWSAIEESHASAIADALYIQHGVRVSEGVCLIVAAAVAKDEFEKLYTGSR